jgi:hypothetical protein
VKFRATAAAFAISLALVGLGAIAPASAAAPAAGSVGFSVSAADFGGLAAGNNLRLPITVSDLAGLGLSAGSAVITVNRSPFASRADLAAWYSGTTKQGLAATRVATEPMPSLAAGETRLVDATVPASALHFGAAGVYAVSIAYTSGGSTLATARTAVAWKASSTTPTPVALVAPLTVPATTSALLTTKQLATDTAPDGILTSELDELENTPVAIGIDPRILASIRILGKSAPQTAQDWLLRLESVSNDTFPLAWADADLTVGLQAGLQFPSGVKPLAYAIDPAQFAPVITNSPTPDPTATPPANDGTTPPANVDPPLPTSQSLVAFNYTIPKLAWPADNTVVSSDVTKLAKVGDAPILLSSTNITRPASKSPAASAKVGGTQVAVSDSILSTYLREAVEATTRADWTAAMTRLATSIDLVGARSGADTPVMMATLGRGWTDDGTRLERTISALYSRSWVGSLTLSGVLASPSATTKVANRAQAASRVTRVHDMLVAEAREVQFSVIAADPARLTSSRRLLLLAVLSNEWQTDPAGWTSATSAFLSSSHKIITSVQIAESSTVLFLNSKGSLPITVSNGLDQPVTVYLRLRPRTTALAVEKKYRLIQVTIGAGSQQKALIPVESIANGKVQVRGQLLAAGGTHIGSAKSINVNVQAGWETVGTLIFGGLVVAVFAFGIVRNIRKRRKAPSD